MVWVYGGSWSRMQKHIIAIALCIFWYTLDQLPPISLNVFWPTPSTAISSNVFLNSWPTPPMNLLSCCVNIWNVFILSNPITNNCSHNDNSYITVFEVPEYWLSSFRHGSLDLRRYEKACTLYYVLISFFPLTWHCNQKQWPHISHIPSTATHRIGYAVTVTERSDVDGEVTKSGNVHTIPTK